MQQQNKVILYQKAYIAKYFNFEKKLKNSIKKDMKTGVKYESKKFQAKSKRLKLKDK